MNFTYICRKAIDFRITDSTKTEKIKGRESEHNAFMYAYLSSSGQYWISIISHTRDLSIKQPYDVQVHNWVLVRHQFIRKQGPNEKILKKVNG